MSLDLAIPKDAHTQILERICERNTPAELLCNPQDGATVRARVRFLTMPAADRILIDRPGVSNRPLHLPAGTALRLRFVCDDQRLTFGSRCIEETRHQQANQEVPALVIAAPTVIERDQRRQCYRVPMLLRMPPVPVKLVKINTIRPEEGPQFEGVLQNLSETGAAILVDPAGRRIKVGDILAANFELEDVPHKLDLMADVRWVRPTPSEQTRIGVAWQLDSRDLNDRKIQNEMARFIMAEQRRAILRRRQD